MARDTQSTYLLQSFGGKGGMGECQKDHRRLDIYAQRKGTRSGIVVRTEPVRKCGLQLCRKSWEMAGTIEFQFAGWGCSATVGKSETCARCVRSEGSKTRWSGTRERRRDRTLACESRVATSPGGHQRGDIRCHCGRWSLFLPRPAQGLLVCLRRVIP